MNLVSLLAAPLIIKYAYGTDENALLRYSIAGAAALIVIVAVYVSKRRPIAIGSEAEKAEVTASV
jgi:K(+)-stimulated pyrophosphate-energized sodium pump